MARTARALPVEGAPEPWPDVPANDPVSEVARRFSISVRAAMGDRSVRSVARDAGISHPTLLAVLQGTAWPDLATITRLEFALNADLFSSADVKRDYSL